MTANIDGAERASPCTQGIIVGRAALQLGLEPSTAAKLAGRAVAAAGGTHQDAREAGHACHPEPNPDGVVGGMVRMVTLGDLAVEAYDPSMRAVDASVSFTLETVTWGYELQMDGDGVYHEVHRPALSWDGRPTGVESPWRRNGVAVTPRTAAAAIASLVALAPDPDGGAWGPPYRMDA